MEEFREHKKQEQEQARKREETLRFGVVLGGLNAFCRRDYRQTRHGANCRSK
jgi:hypothetical protein